MFNNRIDIFEENKRLREEFEHERRLRKTVAERCLRLETKVKLLEATLNRILNPNTPSSQIPDTENARVNPQIGSRPGQNREANHKEVMAAQERHRRILIKKKTQY